jgi:protein SCO1/2
MSETPSDRPSSRPRHGLRGPLILAAILSVMALMLLGAVVLPTLVLRANQQPIEVYGAMPDFTLRDQTGAEITEDMLRGHVVIASFIFTRCPTVCPLLTMKMRRVQDRTKYAADRLKLLSFSVDPAYDTPEVLAAYAAGHGADPARWRFLTGDAQAIQRVAVDGMMLALDVLPGGPLPNGAPNLVHAEHFVLLDPELRIRGYYDANDAKRIERMLRDARRLMPKVAPPGAGPSAE